MRVPSVMLLAISLGITVAAAAAPSDNDKASVQFDEQNAAHTARLKQAVQNVGAAEVAFYEAYNRRNTVEKYHVNCGYDSADKHRSVDLVGLACTPQYARWPGSSFELDFDQEYLSFNTHVIGIVSGNQELLGLFRTYAELMKQYDAALADCSGQCSRLVPLVLGPADYRRFTPRDVSPFLMHPNTP